VSDINYSVSMNVLKGNLSNSVNASGITATMNVDGMQSATYTLSGTPTSISTATLTSVGLAFLRNLSTATATTCSVGIVSGGTMLPFSSPRPGETAILRLASGVSYQATGTAGVRLRVDVTEG
jgi:hypothetical protein